MFPKLEKRSWIKIEIARGRSAQDCFQGLREACVDTALPYCTVAQWQGCRSGRPHVDNHTIQLLASMLDVDRRWTDCA
jgi:hypothetical protein